MINEPPGLRPPDNITVEPPGENELPPDNKHGVGEAPRDTTVVVIGAGEPDDGDGDNTRAGCIARSQDRAR